jgi:hypothetical protein
MVEDFCNQAMAEGNKPSVRSIQQQLGGSTASVASYLRQWKEGSQKSVRSAIEIPVEIKQTIASFVEQEIAKSGAELRESLKITIDDQNIMCEELKRLEDALRNTKDDNKLLAGQNANVLADLRAARSVIDGFNAEREKLQNRLIEATERAARSEERLAQIQRERELSSKEKTE